MILNRLSALGIITFGMLSFAANATQPEVNFASVQYGVILGESRLIYPMNAVGVAVSVLNPQEYPVLIQSRVFDENKTSAAPFVVTPPLFRLDPKQQSSLRITKTGDGFSHDKESLYWVCVKGIPPKEEELWAGNNIKSDSDSRVGILFRFAIDNCIKLMVRPNELKGNPTNFAGELKWKIDGKKLIAENPTPFYMNLGKITYDGKEISPHFVPPKSKWAFDLPERKTGQMSVSWQIINDQGGLGHLFSRSVTF